MGIKVYKSGYQVIVDDPSAPDKIYKTAFFTRFGFNGDNVWIKELDHDILIFLGNVFTMEDSAGNPIGNKAAVETYLLAFVGSSGDTASPLESTAPTLSTITIEDAAPTNVVMVFSEPVTGTNLGFTIGGTTSTTFASISGSGTTFTGVLAAAAANGETVVLSYSESTGDFADIGSNALADITTQAVTNNVAA